MKISLRPYAAIIVTALLPGCSGTPVRLGSPVSAQPVEGSSRAIESNACGFHLFGFIPIQINSRLSRAYLVLENDAGGDYITDVSVTETWTYAYIGTTYCTHLKAKAIHAPA